MNNRLFSIVSLLASLAIISCCTNRKAYRIDDYIQKTDTLYLKSSFLDAPVLSPSRIFMQGNKLLVYEYARETPFVVFDSPPTGMSRQIGHKGNGPNEFLSPDPRSFDSFNGGFRLFDAGRIKEVHLKDSGLSVISSEMFPVQGDPVNGLFHLGDKPVFFSTKNTTYEYAILKPSSDVEYFSRYPDWFSGTGNSMPTVLTYVKQVAVKPSGDMFAAFYSRCRAFRIFDKKGHCILEKQVDFPDKAGAHEPDYAAYSSFHPVVNNEYLAVLCDNRPFNSTRTNSELHIWNWDGELIKRLVLPCAVDVYTVDYVSKMFYAFIFDDSDHLYYADISEYI